MHSSHRLALWLALPAASLAAGAALVSAQNPRLLIGAQNDGSTLVSTNQAITPVGTLRRLEGARPKDLAVSPDGRTVAVLATTRVGFYTPQGEPAGEVPLAAGALGIAWSPDGRHVYVSLGSGRVARLAQEDGRWRTTGDYPVDLPNGGALSGGRQSGNPQANGLAVSPDGTRLYAALGIRNAVAVLSLTEMKVTGSVQVGIAPYSVLLSRDGGTLFVANRGGRRAEKGAPNTAPSAGTPVRVNPVTDAAAEGSVSVVDTRSLQATELQVGRQPAGMALSPDGRTLYAASSGDDTLSVIDLPERRVQLELSLRPKGDTGYGQIPTSLALAPDGETLYAACGGGNAVAVVRLGSRPQVTGYLPAGWYPTAIGLAGEQLVVASAKGLGSRPERMDRRFGVHQSVGTVQFVSAADRKELARHTRQVAQNNRWGEEPSARTGRAPVPVPERVGEPSVFKHVVYIIKENHTYDLTLGDMPEGNGDKSLTLFGEEVTPNQHALARDFVLLDNTYTSGTNSADGHQWTGSAVGNGYIEQNYSAHSRSYPYDGGDPLAYSPEGFLWTAARKKGLDVRVYGEFVNRPRIAWAGTGPVKLPTWKALWDDYQAGTHQFRITAETDNAALRPFLHPRFIGFPSIVSDQWRADQYLADLKEFERTGQMPRLSILLLPNDHTAGTRPGMPTPRAAVADNDLATGRIVEALSRSRFWKETLILIIEDDSQLGVDHVDGHRTIAFCVSPYTRRGAVVSEAYNHTSFLRTMELVLGLPAMTRFDRSAISLAACFARQADLKPFRHRPARIALDELNPAAASLRGEARRLAAASDRLDWSDLDRADASVVARAVWESRRPGQPFPWHAYHPVEDEDDAEDCG